MGYQRWDPADISKLKAMVAAGMPRKQILAAFPDRSVTQVRSKMSYLGLRTTKSWKDKPALHRYQLTVVGTKIGNLRKELSPAVQDKLLSYASRHGTTIAGAIDALLRGVE